jgi:hypothetical protein
MRQCEGHKLFSVTRIRGSTGRMSEMEWATTQTLAFCPGPYSTTSLLEMRSSWSVAIATLKSQPQPQLRKHAVDELKIVLTQTCFHGSFSCGSSVADNQNFQIQLQKVQHFKTSISLPSWYNTSAMSKQPHKHVTISSVTWVLVVSVHKKKKQGYQHDMPNRPIRKLGSSQD